MGYEWDGLPCIGRPISKNNNTKKKRKNYQDFFPLPQDKDSSDKPPSPEPGFRQDKSRHQCHKASVPYQTLKMGGGELIMGAEGTRLTLKNAKDCFK